VIYSPEAGEAMQIEAGSAVIAGSILAGADLDTDGFPVWTAPGVVAITTTGNFTMGGLGVDDTGSEVPRGGTILRHQRSSHHSRGHSVPKSPQHHRSGCGSLGHALQ
jgi:hypothetical protein